LRSWEVPTGPSEVPRTPLLGISGSPVSEKISSETV